MNEEINILRMDLGEEIDQVGEGPSQPIHRPHHHDIELPAYRSFPQSIKGPPLVSALGPADPLIDERLGNGLPVSLGHEPKLAQLVLGCLTIR